MTQLEQLRELAEATSSSGHTSIVSYLLRAGTSVHKAQANLQSELAVAANIKSKNTRKDVTKALNSMSCKLKTFARVPNNGLALYAGYATSRV
ncbi:hypothetical protein OAM67_01445 [bacterium]|nr:hypothetical protein [bacterium]